MIKGHTIIELMDPVSGKVTDRVESDNMFTDAISEMVNFALGHAYGNNCLTNLYTQHWDPMLGGILLFDGQIEENPGMLYAPSGVRMTGCGSLYYANANANMKVMGTYNTTESDTSQANIKKFVYDFATEQANGTIACVCLTHKNAGYLGYGVPNSVPVAVEQRKEIGLAEVITQTNFGKQSSYGNETTFGTVNSTFVDFCIDSENDLKYMFRVTSDKLQVLSHPMSPKVLNVFRSVVTNHPYTLEEYNLPYTVSGSRFYHFYNTDEQCLYFWASGSDTYYDNGVQIRIYKYDLVQKTIDSFLFKNSTGGNIINNLAINGTKVYARGHSNWEKMYKQDYITNEVVLLNNNGCLCIGAYRNNHQYIYRGLLTYIHEFYDNAASSRYRDMIIDTSDDTILASPCTIFNYSSNSDHMSCVVPPINNRQMVFGMGLDAHQTGYIYSISFEGVQGGRGMTCNTFSPANYLATINNLETPVTKTPNRTMKVTYIISEDNENA